MSYHANLHDYEIDQMRKDIEYLKATVAELTTACVDPNASWNQWTGREYGPKRTAMQGVRLILAHLGLQFRDVKAVPARVELEPTLPVVIRKRGRK